MKMKGGKLYVGSIHDTKTSGIIMVLGIKDKDTLLIKFLKTGNTRLVSKSAVRKGNVRDKAVDKYGIGTVHKSNRCGDATVITIESVRKRKVRFNTSGVEKIIGTGELRTGKFSDYVKHNYEVGEQYPTVKCGMIRITKVINKDRRMIKFLSNGIEREASLACIKSGKVTYGIDKYAIDSIHMSKNCGLFKITKYIDPDRREITFMSNGVVKNVLIRHIPAGNVSYKVKRLSEEAVREICSDLLETDLTITKIAELHDSKPSTISSINTGKIWKHIVSEYKEEDMNSIRKSNAVDIFTKNLLDMCG